MRWLCCVPDVCSGIALSCEGPAAAGLDVVSLGVRVTAVDA